MKFVNRVEELARLKKIIKAKKPGFIAVYGRRRCGKSTLLKQVLSENDIYFMADQTESSQQMAALANAIAEKIPGFNQVVYPSWEVLLTAFNQRITRKLCLVLDEFPYLVKSTPALPSILQKLVDQAENKYHLIICGSSQQLMHGMVLASTAPLFGRADLILPVKPMKLAYLQEALKCNAQEAIEEYSVWGGVPRYWELRLQEKNLHRALKKHLFSPLGTLIEEPLRLFVDDMRDTALSYSILSLIGKGSNRLSEIAARLEKPATQLSGPLEKLVQLGYIEREWPFGENEKNSKKGIYKIADPFMHFYFSFIVPNRSLIEIDKGEVVLKRINQQFSHHMGLWWEKLCRQAISGATVNGITFGTARRWWGKISKTEQLEIDVVAESTDGKTILLGECKWSEKENTQKLIEELEIKAQKLPFTRGKKIITCLFLKTNPKQPQKNKVFLPDEVIAMLK